MNKKKKKSKKKGPIWRENKVKNSILFRNNK